MIGSGMTGGAVGDCLYGGGKIIRGVSSEYLAGVMVFAILYMGIAGISCGKISSSMLSSCLNIFSSSKSQVT